MKIFILILTWLTATVSCIFAQARSASEEMQFVRLLNGNNDIYGRVELKSPFLKEKYLLVNDSLKVTLEEVKSYQTSDGYYSRYQEPGYAFYSFPKRISKGKVDLYETIRVNYRPMMMGPGGTMTGGGTTTSTYLYFSKGDGEMQKVKYKKLVVALQDNEKSMAMLNQYHSRGNTALVFGLVGGATVITGLAIAVQTKEGETPKIGVAFTGMGLIGISYLINLSKGHLIYDSIDEYNK